MLIGSFLNPPLTSAIYVKRESGGSDDEEEECYEVKGLIKIDDFIT